jgi:hypothetical protein
MPYLEGQARADIEEKNIAVLPGVLGGWHGLAAALSNWLGTAGSQGGGQPVARSPQNLLQDPAGSF